VEKHDPVLRRSEKHLSPKPTDLEGLATIMPVALKGTKGYSACASGNGTNPGARCELAHF
jgi:hypothetical protein